MDNPHTSDITKQDLINLIRSAQWYQPMSNSSPSCPWCLNMKHWGHSKDCPVTKLGIADSTENEDD